jgi:hypothetical protein
LHNFGQSIDAHTGEAKAHHGCKETAPVGMTVSLVVPFLGFLKPTSLFWRDGDYAFLILRHDYVTPCIIDSNYVIIVENRSQQEVKLTAKGKKVLEAALPVFKSTVSDLLGNLPLQKQKECQHWHRELRDRALDLMHLVVGEPSENITGKPINLKW